MYSAAQAYLLQHHASGMSEGVRTRTAQYVAGVCKLQLAGAMQAKSVLDNVEYAIVDHATTLDQLARTDVGVSWVQEWKLLSLYTPFFHFGHYESNHPPLVV
jgi:hypothetical protein